MVFSEELSEELVEAGIVFVSRVSAMAVAVAVTSSDPSNWSKPVSSTAADCKADCKVAVAVKAKAEAEAEAEAASIPAVLLLKSSLSA